MAIIEYPQILLILPFVFYLLYLRSRRRKTPSEPTNWPLVGMIPAVLLNLRRAHDYATEVLTESGGTYEIKGPWFCNVNMLFTSDPANIHHVFSRNFTNYPKGPEFRKIFEILGDGIFGADFELWEVHRRTTLSLLNHVNFSGFLERAIWRKVETGLIPVLDCFCESGSGVDLQDVFQRFTFDNICRLVLDHDPCSLSVELPYVPCEKAFSSVAEPLLHRHVMPESFWKLQRWMNCGGERKLVEASRAFDEFIYPLVGLKKSEDKKSGYEEEDDNINLLRAFEKVYKEKNIGSSRDLRKFLKDTALSLMFAGRDTTSTCLTWLFWLIATNPSAEGKILDELIESELNLKKWRFFNVEETWKLKYLHGALCESLRLFPPVALEHKAPVKPDILPSGHFLAANAKLIFSFYSVGRMESVWGKDCLEFKPERWITARGGMKHEASYKFPAFNAGPRTCLGKEMAFVQMKMVAAAIIYHYKVKLVEGHIVAPRDSIILQARNGLRVTLSKRPVKLLTENN